MCIRVHSKSPSADTQTNGSTHVVTWNDSTIEWLTILSVNRTI